MNNQTNINFDFIFNKLDEAWSCLQLLDQRRLAAGRQRLEEMIRKNEVNKHPEAIRNFLRKLDNALKRCLGPHTEKMRILYPEDLPITQHKDELLKAIKENQIIIVCGATGSGKTTQLPKIALEANLGRLGRIGCTQPRRLAATALSQRLAAETGTVSGEEVGCKIRFDDQTSNSTVVKFMTDGILLAETRSDRDLLQYECIILDEVHERSLNIDFLLGYMKLLTTRRKDLKLIISSATMEADRLSEFFNNAPIIEIPGTLYPITDEYLPIANDMELPEAVARALEMILEIGDNGDVLVFLPGEHEIKETLEYLESQKYKRVEILPLFGRLSSNEQNKIFKRSTQKRVILATNVAETSVTIPGIRYVIDSGLVRLNRFNPKSGIQELRIEQVSQASARQRRGRCGRLSDGLCIHLYSEEDLQQAPPYTAPEIQRSSLAGVILQMAALHLPKIETFPFLDPPRPALIKEGIRTLNDLEALESESNFLTPLGKRLSTIPLDPGLGKMMITSQKYNLSALMAVITGFLSIPDPRERPMEQSKAAEEAHRKMGSELSDYLGIIHMWSKIEEAQSISNTALRNFCKKNFLSFKRVREWKNLYSDLLEEFPETTPVGTLPETALKNSDQLHKIILGGMPRHFAVYDQETKLYTDLGGKKFTIFPGSGLARRKNPPRWLMFFTLMETSRVFGRCVGEVEAIWLHEVAPQLCKAVYDNIHYDDESGFVYSRERLTAGSLIIHPGRRRHYGDINPIEARKIFIQEALVTGIASLYKCKWLTSWRHTFERITRLEKCLRSPGCLLDENAVFEHFDKVLPANCNSITAVKKDFFATKRNYAPKIEDVVSNPSLLAKEEDFPETIDKYKVVYRFEPGENSDGATLFIPEEELNLLDCNRPDYLVPGLLEVKVEHMLRSLPKAIRREISPIAECANLFCKLFKDGDIFILRPLEDALVEYLANEYDVEVERDAFDNLDFPEFLILKLALLNPTGRIVKVLREYPNRKDLNTRLASNASGITCHNAKPSDRWPTGDDEMPEIIKIANANNRTSYQALAVENALVGTALFLSLDDAKLSHFNGVMQLAKIQYNIQMKYWKNRFKLNQRTQLTFFASYSDWKENFLDYALYQVLPTDPWDIRSKIEFEYAFDKAFEEIGTSLDNECVTFDSLMDTYDKIRQLLKRLPDFSFSKEDIKQELDFFFRPNFLATPQVVSEYPRYLKSLLLRTERAVNGGAGRDENKGDEIWPYVERFRAAILNEKTFIKSGPLQDYFLLLEEARINVFTPEYRPKRKASAKVLEKAWQELRL